MPRVTAYPTSMEGVTEDDLVLIVLQVISSEDSIALEIVLWLQSHNVQPKA